MKKYVLYLIILSIFPVSCASSQTSYLMPINEKRVYMGLEIFLKNTGKYKGKKCLLVTNHSGIDRYMNSNIDLLIAQGIDVRFIMAPEHGLY